MATAHTNAVAPEATLDTCLSSLFKHGAAFLCPPKKMDTIYERHLHSVSSTIRARPDWIEVIKDADNCARWAAEAKAKDVTDREFRYALAELKFYASLHSPSSNIRLSAADGVWLSDTLIDAETTKEPRDYASVLGSVPDKQKDWHPEIRSRALNLIDPSLYPLVYGHSWLHRKPIASPQAALNLDTLGERPGSLDEWRQALNGTGDDQPEHYLPVVDEMKASYASGKFSWLPSEFRVDDSRAVMIESYINNLHPVRHATLYPIIASIFSKFLPLLEHVLTDLVHPRQLRVELDLYNCYSYDGPKPERDDQSYYEYLDDLRDWEDSATYVEPEPKSFSVYGGKGWSIAGLDNKCIIATGIFFYDVVNISQCSLEFREPFNAAHDVSTEMEYAAIIHTYDLDMDFAGGFDRTSQELGKVDIKDGLCVVFPNTYQYKMSRIARGIASKPGHCKMLTFYYVDPSKRIPSTEIVPPQQRDWWMEQVLASKPLCNLPLLVVDGIIGRVDSPISLKNIKQIRLDMEAEVKKKMASVS
ncbi:hypothetical protein IWW39_003397 [Coemansia spiralis]|uniref:DUF4246 domain-containing protein n=1 Tax=Coemansia spiralis TaxID=417178 RepID=A0A9W8GIE6_9FUNG|nr:hypothetical protein IWW39_003397 [Coemansia spiralis]